LGRYGAFVHVRCTGVFPIEWAVTVRSVASTGADVGGKIKPRAFEVISHEFYDLFHVKSVVGHNPQRHAVSEVITLGIVEVTVHASGDLIKKGPHACFANASAHK